jgi:hypothetical protein
MFMLLEESSGPAQSLEQPLQPPVQSHPAACMKITTKENTTTESAVLDIFAFS